MKTRLSVAALVLGLALAALSLASPSHATIMLQDNFNGEHGGLGVLNYYGFANWSVPSGSVDLIGNGYYDFYPGNGLYIDLDGSTGAAGPLTTNQTFGAGSYTLTFDLGGSQRGNTNTVEISLGNWSTSLLTYSSDPLQSFSYTFTTSGGQLEFQNLGGDNVGAILDNVQLDADSAPVPEPGTLMLLGVGLFGLAVYGKRRANA